MMPESSHTSLTGLLKFTGKLEVADIGAAAIAEEPPYKALIDLGIARLSAFDADARHHPKLKEIYGQDISLFSEIVGDGSIQTLHVANPASGMTSLLKPSEPHLSFFNGFTRFGKIDSTEQVATVKLDEVAGLPELDFLKMDIQGAELQVLKHGTKKLARCSMIQLEVSFVPLYEGQPPFGEIDLWMRSQGFIPHCFTDVKRWSISPITRNNDDRTPFNQLLEADIVYVKDPVMLEKWDVDLLRRTALIAHYCYRSLDLTGRIITHLQSKGELAENSLDQYFQMVNSGH